jgi:acyl-coenzyme A thioesterase PaaI-like protein
MTKGRAKSMENLDRHVQNTHLSVSEDLVGKVERIESGKFAQVSLTVDSRMRVDEKGLVHGGFAFGLADYKENFFAWS